MGSVDEVRSLAIAEKVDRFLRQSAQDWSDWFQSNLKFALSDCSPEWDEILEFVERRHLVVHTGARFTRRYLQRVKLTSPPPEGATLLLSADYFREAIDRLRVVGILAAVVSWIKLDGSTATAAVSRSQQVLYDHLLQEKWDVTRLLSIGGLKLRLNDEGRHIFQSNLWLSLKHLGTLGEERKTIEQWDTSALDVRFRIVQRALLDDMDGAIQLVPEAITFETCGPYGLCDWPILGNIRGDTRFLARVAEYFEQHPTCDTNEWRPADRRRVKANVSRLALPPPWVPLRIGGNRNATRSCAWSLVARLVRRVSADEFGGSQGRRGDPHG